MSIFSRILAKIFPSDHPSVTAPPSASGVTPRSSTPVSTPTESASVPSVPADASTAPRPATLVAPVDVDAVLSGLSAKNPGPANWRTSIVDLMKLLQIDSDLTSRKELAKELGYSGDTADSATMNVWLHKQVMLKLAENGGSIPAEFR